MVGHRPDSPRPRRSEVKRHKKRGSGCSLLLLQVVGLVVLIVALIGGV